MRLCVHNAVLNCVTLVFALLNMHTCCHASENNMCVCACVYVLGAKINIQSDM